MRKRNSTRVEEGRKCWILVAIKMKDAHLSGVVGAAEPRR